MYQILKLKSRISARLSEVVYQRQKNTTSEVVVGGSDSDVHAFVGILLVCNKQNHWENN